MSSPAKHDDEMDSTSPPSSAEADDDAAPTMPSQDVENTTVAAVDSIGLSTSEIDDAVAFNSNANEGQGVDEDSDVAAEGDSLVNNVSTATQREYGQEASSGDDVDHGYDEFLQILFSEVPVTKDENAVELIDDSDDGPPLPPQMLQPDAEAPVPKDEHAVELIDDSNDGPPLPPQMLQPDEEDETAKVIASKKSRTPFLELFPDTDSAPPVPPHMAQDDAEDDEQKIKPKYDSDGGGSRAQNDGPSSSSPSSEMKTSEHDDDADQENTDQVEHSNETRTDEETPPTSTVMPSIRPPPPSMLASSPNDETPQAPIFYPVEATLVRPTEVQREQLTQRRHPSAPVIHGVLVSPDELQSDMCRRHRAKIGCGILIVIAAIAAAATAGALIGSNENNGDANGSALALGGEDSPVSSPTTSSRPSGSPTLTKVPSSFPTFGSTTSPTGCPTTNTNSSSLQYPSSPIANESVCVTYHSTLFDEDRSNVPDVKRVCENSDKRVKDCTPDAAVDGNMAVVSRGYNSIYFMTDVKGGEKFESLGNFSSDLDVFDIAISGNMTVVGTPTGNIVHTFVKNATTGLWDHLDALLTPFNTTFDTEKDVANFGTSLSIDGDVLVVGAPGIEDVNLPSPSAYIYRWNGIFWDMEAKLTPDVLTVVMNDTHQQRTLSNKEEEYPLRVLGNSVAVKGNMVAVTDSRYSKSGKNRGGVFVYEYQLESKSWRQVHDVISVSKEECDRHFGASLALTHDGSLLISCPRLESWQGAVYFYTRTGPGCAYFRQQIILASDGERDSYFGYMDQIAVDGNGMAIGSSTRRNGKVYFFTRVNDVWKEVTMISAPDDVEYFGYEVALSGKHVVINSQTNAFYYLIEDCGDEGNMSNGTVPGP